MALSRGDQFLGTDKLTYNRETGDYVAEGNVRYQDSGMRVIAERAAGNQEHDTHRIEDLQYQLTRRRGNGGAEAIEMQGTKGSLHRLHLLHLRSRRSACGNCGPDASTSTPRKAWAWRATPPLRIGKVPVMYVPWFMFPIDERRRTGLLFPSFSKSDRNGFDYRQPIYLNLAPNYDATLHPRYMSERGSCVGRASSAGCTRKAAAACRATTCRTTNCRRTSPSATSSDGIPIPGASLPEDDRGLFSTQRHPQPQPQLVRAREPGLGQRHALLRGLQQQPLRHLDVLRRSTAGLYGRGRRWDAGLMADHRQLADYTLTERSLPFDRLPRAFSLGAAFGRWFTAGVDTEAVRFSTRT